MKINKAILFATILCSGGVALIIIAAIIYQIPIYIIIAPAIGMCGMLFIVGHELAFEVRSILKNRSAHGKYEA